MEKKKMDLLIQLLHEFQDEQLNHEESPVELTTIARNEPHPFWYCDNSEMLFVRLVANHFFPSEKDRTDERGWSWKCERHESHVPDEFIDRFNGSMLECYDGLYLVHIDNQGNVIPAKREDLQKWWKAYIEYDELQESLVAYNIKTDTERKAFFLLCLMAKDHAIGQTYDTYIYDVNKNGEFVNRHEGMLGKKIINSEKGEECQVNTYLLYAFNQCVDWLLKELKRGKGGRRALVASRMVHVLGISTDSAFREITLSGENNENLKLTSVIQKVKPQKAKTQNKYYSE